MPHRKESIREMEMEATSVPQAAPGLNITTERLDDIPLLVGQMVHMGLPELLDEHFPPHGNWQGLSLGWLTTFWCAHIISQADHRLNHLQPWASRMLLTLAKCCGSEVSALDFTDDRLGVILEKFSDDENWYPFEGALARGLITVYDLDIEQGIRLDSTSSCGYWNVTEDGLFQFGHSKDKRPDLPQLKVMLSVLEPMGLSLITTVISGEKADDPLYLPAVAKVRESLGRRGLLYIGDAKMAAIGTRATLAQEEDHYLCPLPKKQVSAEELEAYLKPVFSGEQELEQCVAKDKAGKELTDEQGQAVVLAEGYEVLESLEAEIEGQKVKWNERRLIVRSMEFATKQEENLRSRLAKGLELLHELNERKQGKKVLRQKEEASVAVELLLTKHKIEGLVEIEYKEVTVERKIRGYKGSKPHTVVEQSIVVKTQINESAVDAAISRLGWRVLGTNASKERLSFDTAVLRYRANYSIEGTNFRRLKGQPLSLRPMFLQRTDRSIGLVRLLGLCLRVMGLLEFRVREKLKEEGEALKDVYAGNPARKTMRPSAELLLYCFRELTLTKVELHGVEHLHVTALSVPQQRILALLELPPALYQTLELHACRPPPQVGALKS